MFGSTVRDTLVFLIHVRILCSDFMFGFYVQIFLRHVRILCSDFMFGFYVRILCPDFMFGFYVRIFLQHVRILCSDFMLVPRKLKNSGGKPQTGSLYNY